MTKWNVPEEEAWDAEPKPKPKIKRVAKAKLLCYECGKVLWVKDEDPDKLLIMHRNSRRCPKKLQSWEFTRYNLYVTGKDVENTKKKKRTKSE